MKKTGIIWVIFLLTPLLSLSQEQKFNQTVPDAKSGKDILVGYCTRDSLQGSIFREYFTKEYSSYSPGEEAMTGLLEKIDLLKKIHITIIMGTWCSDSQQQVPRFLKVTDNAQYNGNVTIICVDRDKLAGEVSLEGKNLMKVPTFIITRNGAEIGRITETPAKTLEDDLNSILSK